MTVTEFTAKTNYFTNLLGSLQVTLDQGLKWGLIQNTGKLEDMKKSFIYLNTLSRYSPESSNSIDEQQAEFIFTQLGKLLT